MVKVQITESEGTKVAKCYPNRTTPDQELAWSLLMWDKNTIGWYGRKKNT